MPGNLLYNWSKKKPSGCDKKLSVSSYCKWKNDIPRSLVFEKSNSEKLYLLRRQMRVPGCERKLYAVCSKGARCLYCYWVFMVPGWIKPSIRNRISTLKYEDQMPICSSVRNSESPKSMLALSSLQTQRATSKKDQSCPVPSLSRSVFKPIIFIDIWPILLHRHSVWPTPVPGLLSPQPSSGFFSTEMPACPLTSWGTLAVSLDLSETLLHL